MTLDVVSAATAPTDWVAEIQALSKAAFVARHDSWFLIGRSPLAASAPLGSTISTRVPNVSMALALKRHETQKLPAVRESRPDGPPTAFTRIVRALRKRTDVFANMITLGRTANNDVYIPDASVSKFHAYFQIGGLDDGVRIIDAGSHNGTRIDDEVCPPRVPMHVRPGARLELGRIHLLLVSADACWDTIHAAVP